MAKSGFVETVSSAFEQAVPEWRFVPAGDGIDGFYETICKGEDEEGVTG
jgi:hypothetical protein